MILMCMLGICFASFINVVIYRLPLHLNPLKGRSFCPSCHHQLHFYDLIPVMSFFFLKGRCRYCHQRLDFHDTMREVIGGFIGMICFLKFQMTWEAYFYLVLAMVFMAVSVIDIKTMEIPYSLLVVCLMLMICSFLMQDDLTGGERLLGSMIVSCPMILCNVLIKESFGGGDVMLLMICGMMLGWKIIVLGTIIAILLAGIVAFYLVFICRREDKYMAFAPYLCVGMFIAILYGEPIVRLYLSL